MKQFNKKGFTLIELIVVMVIIGISSSIVLLNVKLNRGINKKKFVTFFVRLLQKARVESIVNNKTTILIINPEKRLVTIKGDKKDKLKIPEEVTLTAEKIIENGNEYFVYFFYNGSSTGLNINIYGKNFSKKIIVNPITGLIKSMDIAI